MHVTSTIICNKLLDCINVIHYFMFYVVHICSCTLCYISVNIIIILRSKYYFLFFLNSFIPLSIDADENNIINIKRVI